MRAEQTRADPVVAMGEEITLDAVKASEELYRVRHEAVPEAGVRVEQDVRYGADDRQKMDVYVPDVAGEARPVVLFVHGGNFVGGDKSRPGSPYHGNVGRWAARQGWVGVVISYRLAPAHQWPAGALDLGAAVERAGAEASSWGADPAAIVLVGASAGAVHVADYLTRFRQPDDGVRGAALLSGIYDPGSFEDRPVLTPYLGEDDRAWPAEPVADLFAAVDVPLLFGIAEHDPPRYHRQTALAIAKLAAARGRLPHLAWAAGHNHLTEIHHLGAEASTLDAQLRAFVGAVAQKWVP